MGIKTTIAPILLFTALFGCVSTQRYHALELKNQDLQLQADYNADFNADLIQQEADLADHATALAQQNLDLKMDKAALMAQAKDRRAEFAAVTRDLRKEIGAGELRITRYKDMLTLDVADAILFDSAKASLKPDGMRVLLSVGKVLQRSRKLIRVIGHTDDEAMAKGADYASNWELSTARATTVVRYLQEQAGLDPSRLAAIGRGEWRPVASNATAAGRRLNRRIQITLIDPDLLNGSEGQRP